MEHITTYHIRNRHFEIVLNDGWYLAIEDKYITDGKCNTALNGWQMFAAHDLDECLTHVTDRVEIDYLVSTGLDQTTAFAMRFNLMDKLDTLKTILN